MINEKDIEKALRECGDKRKAIQQLAKLLLDWDTELQHMESDLCSLAYSTRCHNDFEQRFIEEVQLSIPGMEPSTIVDNMEEVSPVELRRRHGRKPDTQVIEEIFQEHGPLHVSDLVPIAQERGVPFTGNKQPSQMARDKMYSCKRFVLFGNNVWGLPNQELPEKYKKRGRGNRPLNDAAIGEADRDYIQVTRSASVDSVRKGGDNHGSTAKDSRDSRSKLQNGTVNHAVGILQAAPD